MKLKIFSAAILFLFFANFAAADSQYLENISANNWRETVAKFHRETNKKFNSKITEKPPKLCEFVDQNSTAFLNDIFDELFLLQGGLFRILYGDEIALPSTAEKFEKIFETFDTEKLAMANEIEIVGRTVSYAAQYFAQRQFFFALHRKIECLQSRTLDFLEVFGEFAQLNLNLENTFNGLSWIEN